MRRDSGIGGGGGGGGQAARLARQGEVALEVAVAAAPEEGRRDARLSGGGNSIELFESI